MRQGYSNCRLYSCSLSLLFCATFLLSSWCPIGVKAFVVVGAIESSSSSVFTPLTTDKRILSMKMAASDDLSKAELDQDTSEFHQYAAAAVDLSSGHLSSNSVLSVVRSVRNWELNARQSYLYRFHLGSLLSGSSEIVDDSMPPIPLDSSVKVYLPSPSGKKMVVIKTESKDGTETSESIVEVWQGASLTRRIKVGGKGVHGKVINDPVGFGVPTWSPDEKILMYSAERLSPTTVPFWTADTKDEDVRGGQNVLGQGTSENWGETYHKQEAILDLYLLNLSTGRLGCVETSDSITLGQAVWHPEGSKIALTGWSTDQPKRLGMVYCRNRVSKIYESEVSTLLQELSSPDATEGKPESSFSCVSSDLHYSRSPRYVHGDDGNVNLVFLGSEAAFVSHDAAMGLYRWDEKDKKAKNIIPVFQDPSPEGANVAGLGFPGLYLGQLPMNCDLGNNYLVTNTLWGSFQRVIRIDIKNGKVQLIDIPELDKLASHSLCAVSPNGDLVISEISCEKPASLWVVKENKLIPDTTQEADTVVDETIVAKAHRVSSFSPIATTSFCAANQAEEKAYTMQVVTIESGSVDGAESFPIQSLLLVPKKSVEKVPMIVVPHGGPHSCSASAFSPGVAYLATKYAVLLPNYRGSIGFGQGPLNSLPTRIGRVDVQDVMLSAKYAIDNFSFIDGERVGICGGSHGGFLTAHCTSQYPEFFKAGKKKSLVLLLSSFVNAFVISNHVSQWQQHFNFLFYRSCNEKSCHKYC